MADDQQYLDEYNVMNRAEIFINTPEAIVGGNRYDIYKTLEWSKLNNNRTAEKILDVGKLGVDKTVALNRYKLALNKVPLLIFKNPSALFLSWLSKNMALKWTVVKRQAKLIFNEETKLLEITQDDFIKYIRFWENLPNIPDIKTCPDQ